MPGAQPEPRPVVLLAEDLDPEPTAWLGERCRLIHCASSDGAFAGHLGEADGLIVRTYTRVDRALLDAGPRLRVVARAGVGVDNIDLDACAARGIPVINAPGANTRAVVEFVGAAMLDALRPRVYLDRPLDLHEWKGVRRELEAPRQLADLTLGILGLGRIGSQVARLARALDMRVLYHDLRDIPDADRFGAEPVSRDDLLAGAEVLSIHVDGRLSNRSLISRNALFRMRPDVVLINTSRGFVVEPSSAADFFRSRPGAQAIFDVHEPEPFGPDYPLLGLANVRLSPHIAGATRAAKLRMSWVVRDVWRVLRGEPPRHRA